MSFSSEDLRSGSHSFLAPYNQYPDQTFGNNNNTANFQQNFETEIAENKLFKSKDRFTTTIHVHKDAYNQYKKMLRKRIAWGTLFFTLIAVEWLFGSDIVTFEVPIIDFIQTYFGITELDQYGIMHKLTFVTYYQFSNLLLTHVIIVFYYLKSPTSACKLHSMTALWIFLIVNMQLMYSDPRPFWVSDRIVGAGCPNSFAYPSVDVFIFLFVFAYGKHCWGTQSRTLKSWIRRILFAIVFSAFMFYKVLAGFIYFYQAILSMFYVALFYYFTVAFDREVNKLIEKSTVDTQEAKRYTIFWFLLVVILEALTAAFSANEHVFHDITWYQNYFECLNTYGRNKSLANKPFNSLLGSWSSFLKTSAFLTVTALMFAAAKTFRDFQGSIWFKTSKVNRWKMIGISTLCMIPSWLLVYLGFDIAGGLSQLGIMSYLLPTIHYSLLYFLIFGVLPYHFFRKRGWTAEEEIDEMVKINDSFINQSGQQNGM